MNPAELRIQVTVLSRNAQAQLDALSRAVARTRSAGGAGGGANSFLDSMIGKVDKALTAVGRLGQRLQSSGRQLTNTFTLPIALAAGAGVKFALDNERAFTSLKKVYGSIDDPVKSLNGDLKLLRQSFEALSDIYGVQQSEVIQIGALWAQAGDKGASLAKDVRLTIDTMLLGEMSYEQAGKALIVLRSQYHLTADELKKNLAILNVIENETAVSYTDLIEAIVRGGGTAVSAGVDIRHFGAMVASLVPATGTAEKAGNGLKTILSRLFAPTKQAADVMKLLGVNILSSSFQSLNGTQRLELLAQKFKGLSSAQQLVAATAIGTRFQVSSFATLLRDIVNPLGNYQKALKATADEQKNAAVYSRELGILLASDPQAFKIAMTQLQNALARIVVPLLPALLSVARGIAQVVDSFTRLNPQTQKHILFWIGFLAVVGPVIRVVGGLIYVFELLGRTLLLPFRAIALLDKALVKLFGSGLLSAIGGFIQGVGSVLGAGFQAIGTGIEIIAGRMMGLWQSILVVWESTILPAMQTIGTGAGVAFITAFEAIQGVLETVGLATMTLWYDVIVPAMTTIGTAAGVAFITAYESVKEGLAALAIAATIIWSGVIVPAMAPIGAAAAAVFEAAFATLGIALPALGAAIVAALPEILVGGLVIGVVAALILMKDRINTIISATMRWLVDATQKGLQAVINFFGKLPQYIGDALMGVFRAVMSIGSAIYHALFDFLNPFQRHSPSLVDLVIAGVDVISAKYKSLKGIGSEFRAGVADLRAFKQAMTEVTLVGRQQDRGKAITKLAKSAPGAVQPAVAVFKVQDKLYVDLDRVTAAYGRQDLVVQKWAARLEASQKVLDLQSTKLTHLQAVADALSTKLGNAQASLDKWSNTPIAGMQAISDQIFDTDQRSKALELRLLKLKDATAGIDEIRGQLELLSGQREALRLKGAGSDVLAPFNDQIKNLTSSSSGIASTVAEMVKLQQEIDKLATKSQELTLSQSLQFDPLTRQIEQASKSMKEMPFSVIIGHVRNQKRLVDQLGVSYRIANNQVRDQQVVVKNAQVAHDKLQVTYDLENKKLSALSDTYEAIKNMIDAIDQSFQSATSSANSLTDSLFNAAGAGNFKSPLGTAGLLPDKQSLDSLVKQWQDEANKAFGNIDIGDAMKKPFRDAWASVQDWWHNDVVDWWHRNVSWDAFQMPGGKWNIGEKLMGVWDNFTSWWSGTAIPWLQNLPETLIGAFAPLVHGIGRVLSRIGHIIVAPFKWAYDKLVGHSIIPELVHAIVRWFTGLPGRIVRGIGNLGRTLARWAQSGADYLFDHIGTAFGATLRWFAGLPGRVWDSISQGPVKLGVKLAELFGNVGSGIASRLAGWFKGILDFFGNLGGSIASKVGDLSGTLLSAGGDLVKGLYKGIQGVVKSIGSTVGKIPIIGSPLKSVYDTVTSWPFAEGGVAQPRIGGINAKIAEAGRPELVAPLPNGFSMGRLVHTMNRLEHFVDNQGTRSTLAPVANAGTGVAGKTENHFHGNLIFPNVKSGDDAEAFIRNIESLI